MYVISVRPQTESQDGHLDFHTAELGAERLFTVRCEYSESSLSSVPHGLCVTETDVE